MLRSSGRTTPHYRHRVAEAALTVASLVALSMQTGAGIGAVVGMDILTAVVRIHMEILGRF